MKYFLVHYSEIALKGKNRPFFERKLAENIRAGFKLAKIEAKTHRLSGRFLIEAKDDANKETAGSVLSAIFGISSYAPCAIPKTDFEEIAGAAEDMISQIKNIKTFKAETRRSHKQFSKNSMEISRDIGAHILKKFPKLRVDVKNPDVIINIEVAREKSFVYSESYRGAGGMPVGTSGRALCLISGGIDSPVASYMMMRRGAPVDFVHFHSYPQTDKASIEKTGEIIKILSKFQPAYRPKVHNIPILDFQKEVLGVCDPRFRIILYRRMMYRLAEKIASLTGCVGLASGDNLAQVASQTMENMAVVGYGINAPIFRPLLCFDKEEIINIARRIGTYDVSIEPHGDCCSVFSPKNPATKARLADVLKEEIKLEKIIKK